MRKFWSLVGVEFEDGHSLRLWNQMAVGVGAVLAGVLLGISWGWAIIPGAIIATAGAWLALFTARSFRA